MPSTTRGPGRLKYADPSRAKIRSRRTASNSSKSGGRVSFAFPATIDGRFVVELESSGTQLAELDVEP